MINILKQFKEYLLSQKDKPSKFTIKNYCADINQFIRWYESHFRKTFELSEITFQIIDLYKNEKTLNLKSPTSSLSPRSVERHLSSLRKFFHFLKIEGLISHNPMTLPNYQSTKPDPWRLKDFKDYLYVYNASKLTIKNYIIDIRQFLAWAEKVTGIEQAWEVREKNIFTQINSALIEEYKQRLIEQNFTATTVNRKLSSLRKYFSWAEAEGMLKNGELEVRGEKSLTSEVGTLEHLIFRNQKIEDSKLQDRQEYPTSKIQPQYSPVPPLRLLQKMGKAIGFLFDEIFIYPLAKGIEYVEYVIWKLRGKPVFETRDLKLETRFRGLKLKSRNSIFQFLTSKSSFQPPVSNLKKEFYAPAAISTKYYPWYKKLIHHARYTRPKWYKAYHSYSITHYFHLAILIIFMSALGIGLYNGLIRGPQNQNPLLAAAPTAPPRILSFQGRLTDNNDNPITTAATALRFAIYNDATASGSALLWQEIVSVSPDTDGIFSTLLGNNTTITQSLFAQNATLYLGVTVGRTPELTPRQQLATVAYATNAEVLQGLPPVTDSGVTGNTNAILALNSSGTLSIAGTATTTFQAANGQFTITGKPLVLQTNAGTNGNIAFSPDGLGTIDLQKPLQNTTNTGNLVPGGVEIDDKFGVLATESAVAAFMVNNNTTGGDIFTASSSGTPRFVINNAGNVGIGTTSPGTTLAVSGNGTVSTNFAVGKTSINTNNQFESDQSISSDIFRLNGYFLQQISASNVQGLANIRTDTNYTGATGTVTSLTGFQALADVATGGTATNRYGFYVSNGTGGGTMTNQYGVYIEALTKGSTNNIGLYVNTPSGATNNYAAIFAGGNVGIGTTSPTSTLEVAASKTINFNSSPLSNLTLGTNMAAGGYNINNIGHAGLGNTASTTTDVINIGETYSNPGTYHSGIVADIIANETSATNGNQLYGGLFIARVGASNTQGWNSPSEGLRGTESRFVVTSGATGTITTVKGAAARIQNNAVGATISNAYSLYAYNPVATGTITTNYGLYLENQTAGGTNYAIYSAGGTSYFAGNVGIGNTTPLTALDVTGSASLSANLSLRGSGTSHLVKILDNGSLNFATSVGGDGTTNPTLFISNGTAAGSGNVGIGTTTPGYLLEVNGTFKANTTTPVFGAYTLTIPATGTVAEGTGTANYPAYWSGTNTLTAEQYLAVSRGGTGVGTFTTNGVLYGNGTTSVLVTAQGGANTILTANAGAPAFSASPTIGTSVTTPLIIGSTSANGTLTLEGNNTTGNTATNANLIFKVGDSAATTAMTILNNGNVGIGNATPLTALDVTGSASLSANLSLRGSGTSHLVKILDNGSLNFATSVGGDATTNPTLFISNGTAAGSGNVGIGNTAPGTTLDVTGTGRFSSTLTASNGLTLTTGALNLTATSGTAALTLSSSTTAFNVNSGVFDIDTTNSRVGIGTTSPQANLDVGGAYAGGADTKEIRVGSTAGNSVVRTGQGGVNNAYFAWVYNATPASAYAVLSTYGGNNPLVLQNAGGNVGIGNATPLTALDVTGSASLSANLSLRGAATSHTFNILDNGTLNIQRSPGGDAGLAANSVLYLGNNGNVGIGTTAPITLLDVRGTASASGALTIDTTPTLQTTKLQTLTIGGTTTGAIALSPASATPSLFVTNGGNVGIGTTSPSSKLHILAPDNGVYVTFTNTANQGGTFDTDGTNMGLNIKGRGLYGILDLFGGTGAAGNGPLIRMQSSIAGFAAENTIIFNTPNAAGNADTERLRIKGGADTANVYFSNSSVGIGTTSPGALLDVGLAGTTLGVIRLEGNTSGYAALQPTAAAGSVTLTLPATTGTVALGTGTANYPAYWSGTNTLTAEQYLAVSRGGLGASVTAAGGGEILYSTGTTAYGHLAAGSSGQLLISGGTGAPSWTSNPTPPTSGTFGYWQRNSQALSPTNITDDLLMGATATSSALIKLTGTNVAGLNYSWFNAGNVGIGTTAPGGKLQVTATSGDIVRFGYDATTYLNWVSDSFGSGTLATNGSGGNFTLKANQNLYLNVGNATYDMYFQTNTDTKMILKQNGNVGIANTTPLTALDVTGSASLSANLSLRGAATSHTFNILDNGTLNIQRSPGGDAGLAANSVLYLGNNGNVGIGTTTPGYLLEVNGTFKANTTTPVFGAYTLTIPATGTVAEGTGTANYPAYWSGTNTLTAEQYLAVSRGGTGVGTFTTNGVLYGNGTTSVLVTAQGGANTILTANAGAPAFSASPTIGTSVTTPLIIGSTSANGTLTLEGNNTTGNTATNANLIFKVGDSAATTAMTILNNGNVGIANTTPLTALDVTGSASLSANLSLRGAATTHTFNILDNGTLNFQRSPSGDTGLSANSVLYLGNNGNVGIGTTSPGSLLQLGSGNLTWATDNASNIGASGANRPANIYFGSALIGPGNVHCCGAIRLANNQQITWRNVANTDVGGFIYADSSDRVALGGGGGGGASFVLWSVSGGVITEAWQGAVTISTTSSDIRLMPAGNVGIGNTTPLTALDVTGSASLSANLSLRGSGTSHLVKILDNGSLNFATSVGGDGTTNPTLFISNGTAAGSGNVGIGNTAPGTTLDVTGTGRFSSTLTASNGLTLTTGALNLTATSGTAALTLSSSTTAFNVNSGVFDIDTTNSRVGIGTTGPGYKLDVQSTGVIANFKSTSGAGYLIIDAPTNQISRLGFRQNGGDRAGIGMASGEDKLYFMLGTSPSEATAQMVITNTGNVGIGTTSTTGILHVKGGDTGGNTALLVDQTGAATNDIIAASASGTTKFRVNNGGTAYASSFYDLDNTSYFLDPAASGNSLLTAGNVGIGNTTPLTALDVTGSASLSANLSLRGAATAHTFNILGNGTLNIQRSPGGDAGLAANSVLYLGNNGNVGIGTTSPGTNLQVNGEILGQFTAGNNLLTYDNTESLVSGTSYSKAKEIQIGWDGTLRIKFDLKGNGTDTAYGKIYRNGAAVGTERSTALAAYTTYSEDIGGWSAGDLVQIYTKNPTSVGYIRNFQIYVNYHPGAAVTFPVPTDTGDIAEKYSVSETELDIEPGDVVAIANSSTGDLPTITKSKSPYDSKAIGIISTAPAMTLAEGLSGNTRAVALAGRVPVKVSVENGPILIGDPLTSSSVPGVAMKATKAGPIVGKALEPFDGKTGKILAFVNVSWYDPDVYLTDAGNLRMTQDTQVSSESARQILGLSDNLTSPITSDTLSFPSIPKLFALQKITGEVIDRVAAFAEVAVANLKAGLVKAEEITTNSLAVATDSLTIGGQSLRDYIADVVNNLTIKQFNNGIISPIASIGRLRTDFISPIASDSAIAIAFGNSSLEIRNSSEASGSAVAVIDNAGNVRLQGDLSARQATFSGQLNASEARLDELSARQASIAGTLRADKIIANNIEGLEVRVSTIAANYIQNTQKTQTARASDNLTSPIASDSPSIPSSLKIAADYMDISTLSGQLAYVKNLNVITATFTQGLISFGPTSLADTAITGQLSVNGTLILADNSLNVLGSTLAIQPLRQGAISLMGGLVYIDTNGNVKFGGDTEFARDVTIKGTLYANSIAPIPSSKALNPAMQNQLSILNSSGSAVLAVNQQGDISSSGSATFNKLNLTLAQPAFALSPNESLATGSAGVATISAHLTGVTIYNSMVTDKSLIYITPVGEPTSQTPFLMRQAPQKSFTVGVQNPSINPLPFNWLIIN